MQERCGSKLRVPRPCCVQLSISSTADSTLSVSSPHHPYAGHLIAAMARKEKIAKSITNAIMSSDETIKHRSSAHQWRKFLKAVFTIHAIELRQHAEEDFIRLRQTWEIDSKQYDGSFEKDEGTDSAALQTKGTMGYSGSTFFTTWDEKYLVKSVPRHFEHSFFKDDFLPIYVKYMNEHLDSLIIRIVDFLAVDNAYKWSPGLLLGFAPSHHIVMENLLVGMDEGQAYGKNIALQQCDARRQDEQHQSKKNDHGEQESWKWQTWDLKPTTYFFPERDIADGKLTSEATKSRLADGFDDKLILKRSDANDFMNHLKSDTKLLEDANAVDYSLFLVRIPVIEPQDNIQDQPDSKRNPFAAEEDKDAESLHGTTDGASLALTAPASSEPPFTPPNAPSWRTGIKSADGKHIYRAAILDFFWTKHKLYAKIMTKLVKTWNRIDLSGSKGPMSITTNSKEYRDRFLVMCEGFLEVYDDEDGD